MAVHKASGMDDVLGFNQPAATVFSKSEFDSEINPTCGHGDSPTPSVGHSPHSGSFTQEMHGSQIGDGHMR